MRYLKIYSAIFHGILAAVVVAIILMLIAYELDSEIIVLWALSIIVAAFLGWFMANWYAPLHGEKFLVEPYFATLLITLVTSVVTLICYDFVFAIFRQSFEISMLTNSVLNGFYGGLYGFVLSLPISFPASLIMGRFFYKCVEARYEIKPIV